MPFCWFCHEAAQFFCNKAKRTDFTNTDEFLFSKLSGIILENKFLKSQKEQQFEIAKKKSLYMSVSIPQSS